VAKKTPSSRNDRGTTGQQGRAAGQVVRPCPRARTLFQTGVMAGTCRYPPLHAGASGRPAHQCHWPGRWGQQGREKGAPATRNQDITGAATGHHDRNHRHGGRRCRGSGRPDRPDVLGRQPPDLRRLTTRRRREVSGSQSAREISPGQGSRPWEQVEDRHVPRRAICMASRPPGCWSRW
jgi:hypothetical protein